MFDKIILSTDAEFNGDIPGINSLWSIAFAAMKIELAENGYTPKVIDTFEINLEEIPGTVSNPRNMKFWEDYPDAWNYARTNLVEPKLAIEKCDQWLSNYSKDSILVAWPATSDTWYLEYYFERYLGKPAFKGSPLDLRSYTFGAFKNTNWRKAGMDTLPEEWKPHNPTPHRALPDAIAQGHMACRIIIEALTMKDGAS